MGKRGIEKIWLTDSEIWLRDNQGNEACEPYADYPRLKNATQSQRENYVTDDYGIHWPDLDEDLSYEGFYKEKHNNSLYDFFMQHPELNASAIARRLGISQSLFAQYISGQKRPSAQRLANIRAEIKSIGESLIQLGF